RAAGGQLRLPRRRADDVWAGGDAEAQGARGAGRAVAAVPQRGDVVLLAQPRPRAAVGLSAPAAPAGRSGLPGRRGGETSGPPGTGHSDVPRAAGPLRPSLSPRPLL